MSDSRVVRAVDGGWDTVDRRAYKEGEGPYLGVARHTLLGGRDAEDAIDFEVRYFEVAPGGYTSLEHHEHAHAVLVLSGQGTVRLGDERHPIGPRDVVYVAPREVHRFEAGDGAPLGFLCVVDRDRDRPVLVTE